MAEPELERIRWQRERRVPVSGEVAEQVLDLFCGCTCEDEEGHVHACEIVVAAGHRTLADAVVAVRDCSGHELRLTRGQAAEFVRYLDTDVKLDLMVAAGLSTEARVSRAIEAEAVRSRRGIDMDRVYANVVCNVAAAAEPRVPSRLRRRPSARGRRSAVAVSARGTGTTGADPPPSPDAPIRAGDTAPPALRPRASARSRSHRTDGGAIMEVRP